MKNRPRRPAGRFPTIGKLFSNHWKNRAGFSNHWKKSFQSLENPRKCFPIIGKCTEIFSNRWKTGATEVAAGDFALDRERGGWLDGGFAAGVGWTPRRART
ncbi:MAG: hypothetical protein IKO01_02405 [Kiritimatiellae bacterium]|nr:hypothetical protein [Kiritimatiellia bacterium]